MNKKGFFPELLIGIGLILIALTVLFFVGYGLMYALTTGTETITIKEKWVKYHEEDAKYLVSSTNGQVFQITDSIIKWRFDSSNLYSDIEEGDRCDIKTQGWRWGFFSDYKNILEVDC